MAKASPGAPQPESAPTAPSFEDAIEQVEQIIDRIERGEQGLERSIADYERGAGLLKKCREILARSEQRVQEIEADLSAASQGQGAAAPAARPLAPQPLKRSGSAAPPLSGAPTAPTATNAPPGSPGSRSTGGTPASDDGDDTPF